MNDKKKRQKQNWAEPSEDMELMEWYFHKIISYRYVTLEATWKEIIRRL